jgi:ribosomal-protein-alanine N-acetyltransferase
MQLNFESYHITPINLKDGWTLCNFAVANEDRLKNYFPKTLEQNLTPDLSNSFVTKMVKQFEAKEVFLFTLRETETNKLVGLVYIKEVDWNKKQGEFAYCIDYTVESKGLMTEAVKQLSDYAFETLGLETLQIIVYKNNIGSVKVAENNNFTWIKTLENEFTPPGKSPLNMELYELYKKFQS